MTEAEERFHRNKEFSKIYLCTKYAQERLRKITPQLKKEVKFHTNKALKSAESACKHYEKNFGAQQYNDVEKDLELLDDILESAVVAEYSGRKFEFRNFIFKALAKFGLKKEKNNEQ